MSGFDFERTQSLSVVSVATTQLLNSLIARADQDGLPDLSELLASQVDVDDAAAFPLTVGEVAELLGVSGHTLRYYERIGLVDVGRSVSGQRRYDRAALGRVIFITRLRWSGMSIRDITEYVQLVEKGDSTTDERLALLHRHRDKVCRQIDDLKFALAVIDYKIATYGGDCSG
jgi:DNA-binding transcriptional MerR regulator